MHGPGHAPPHPGRRRPATATLYVLRGLLVLLSVVSFGILSWAAMLRVAVLRRRRLDWVLFWISLALAVAFFVMAAEIGEQTGQPEGGEQEQETATGFELALILTMVAVAIAAPVHYLFADIRHFQQFDQAPGHGPLPGTPPLPPYTATAPAAHGYGPPPSAPGYGYPPPAPGYGYPHRQPPAAPSPYTAAAPAPRPAPPHTPPPPPVPASETPRIDQVRAELDELSDYLRREQGR